MKTRSDALKGKKQEMKKKLAELTEEELAQVVGGVLPALAEPHWPGIELHSDESYISN